MKFYSRAAQCTCAKAEVILWRWRCI